MHIEITPESLLIQLGYAPNEATLKQMSAILANTHHFDKFSKHILALEDKIKHTNAIIAMSNTNNYLKIKYEGTSEALQQEFHSIVQNWADKYNVQIQKVTDKEVYYILGGN